KGGSRGGKSRERPHASTSSGLRDGPRRRAAGTIRSLRADPTTGRRQATGSRQAGREARFELGASSFDVNRNELERAAGSGIRAHCRRRRLRQLLLSPSTSAMTEGMTSFGPRGLPGGSFAVEIPRTRMLEPILPPEVISP